ncbi:MAG TPA: hypothetical protein DEE98_00695 [Elusimicrobia bacterium]|nr:MAG: hypothetical protein A2278_03325 [Elusimicrobia bacterium RIFOXYA12_FULL_49_49]OGS10877.1 MAG: hypothetical protein A2386_06740 [Elusimicrobia bacterium RIFOXYB1_FULL_48_9]OGS15594.1 MAG: hypothetical protein A2251_03575 [Elusimicrobia bacterium RIFOXYA2_FULL_47_53]OGS26850.1 MAG: hypothetical protein A2339_07405 [Elusimicrobia bacterium RIFOXYB12_FULL_50_12]OGS30693.1 MAG: hypothetical protein A2323_07380 [Elusimicrobia bacterium RIFOXYB2_FULL_46_23]HBU68884.1 hypothetical protein [El
MPEIKSKKVYIFYTSNSKMYPYFPSSALAISGVMLKSGYEPVIIDTELNSKWAQTDLSDALCVCISTFTGPWLKTAIQAAGMVRKNYPGLKILWGGPHAIALPEVTAKHHLVDCACYTEGENVIVPLLDSVYNGTPFSEVKGVIFRDERGVIVKTDLPAEVEMDSLELPPYQLLDLKLYSIKEGRVYYQTSRGCVFKCRFCSYEAGKKWRSKTPEKVIEDFKKIISMFNPEEFQIFDGNFFVDLSRVRKILEKKLELGLKFKWSAYCRFDTFSRLDESMLSLLRSSGCCELKFGGESGSPKILKYVQKETKPEQIIYGVGKCFEYGITPTLSFMTGFPEEGDAELGETLALINKLRREYPKLAINGLFMLQHLPNTPLTDEILEKYGIEHPKTMEEWVDYHLIWTKKSDYPWMNNREYSKRKTLSSIMSYLYLSGVLENLPKKQRAGTVLKSDMVFALFKAVNMIVRKVFVKLRWDMGVTALPVEWRVWDYIREDILRMC